MRQGAEPVMEPPAMTERDLIALRSAVAALEHPSLAARLGNMVGKPIELIGAALPASAAQAISAATSKALEIALQVALRTMQGSRPSLSQRFHKLLATASGAAVNYAFIEHFQGVARAHFTVRRLERIYGSEIVRKEYERFAQSH